MAWTTYTLGDSRTTTSPVVAEAFSRAGVPVTAVTEGGA